MRKKGTKNKNYSAEFKISVIMDMRKNHLGYCETVRKYGLGSTQSEGAINTLHRWERIYLKEGATGLMTERSNTNFSLGSRLAVPTRRIPKILKRTQHDSKYVQKRKLHG